MSIKKYDKIIVLAAGITQKENGRFNFDDGQINFSYDIEGDNDVFRFKAVKKLLEDKSCSDFILVGGVVKDGHKQDIKYPNGKVVPKARVMKYHLTKYLGVPENVFTCLQSESNTQGNAAECLRYFKENKIEDLRHIGLLTSFYHLPRSIRMFAESGLHLVPVVAESVIYEEEFENINRFYKTEGFSFILNDLKGKDSEIKGLNDWESGPYISRTK